MGSTVKRRKVVVRRKGNDRVTRQLMVRRESSIKRKRSDVSDLRSSEMVRAGKEGEDDGLRNICDSDEEEEQSNSIERMKALFVKKSGQPCNCACSTCMRLFYPHSVKNVDGLSFQNQLTVRQHQYEHRLIEEKKYICNTCYDAVINGRLPTLNADPNGPLHLAELPEPLRDLSRLETILISARILFLRLQQRPSGGQIALAGECIDM